MNKETYKNIKNNIHEHIQTHIHRHRHTDMKTPANKLEQKFYKFVYMHKKTQKVKETRTHEHIQL